MSRRDNAARRCQECRMHASLCVCALVPRLATRTRLVLVIHHREDRKPTNTGRLAAKCLENSQIVVRGQASRATEPEPALVFPEGMQPVILYPAEDAVPLATFAGGERPVALVVPDGNWRQASKVRRRLAGLAGVPAVSLPDGGASAYRLRSEPVTGGLATLEAIARAFGVLEGKETEAAMLRPFRAMVERTLWARGEISADDVQDGLPAGAERHDPESGLARPVRPW